MNKTVMHSVAVVLTASLCFGSAQTQASMLTPATETSASTSKAPGRVASDPVAMIYAATGEDLLWSSYGQPRELAYELLELLQNAPAHGIEPERYALETLYTLIQEAQTEKQLRLLDRALTAAVWSFNEDLRVGAAHEKVRRRNSAAASPNPVDEHAVEALAQALKTGKLKAHLESLPPTFNAYKQLQNVLDTYTDYHLLGGWEPLPDDMFLKPGDRHPGVSALRYRLILTDGLTEEAAGSDVYDDNVQAAIVRFQARHGLAVDGEIGPATLKTLNISAEEKVRRIGINLARLRQLPNELPQDHIFVNIPEFKLRLVRDNEEALTMGVVVGSRRTPTPAMRDEVRHLVFNPYWYPPHNITVQEILPKLRRDPAYLERSGFELLRGKTVIDANLVEWSEISARNFPFRVRQVPGEKNSLGEVKFIFPNKKAIYLHDTPSRNLFGERVRAFSHGCVRLEKPRQLATALMNWDRGWTNEEVNADITAAKRKLRKFKTRMAIYLLYQTASVAKGVVSFHPDIYGHDVATKKSPLLAPLVAQILPGETPDEPDERATPPDNQRVATR